MTAVNVFGANLFSRLLRSKGLTDGLDESLRAEILADTLSSIKEDLKELCSVDRRDLREVQDAEEVSSQIEAIDSWGCALAQ